MYIFSISVFICNADERHEILDNFFNFKNINDIYKQNLLKIEHWMHDLYISTPCVQTTITFFYVRRFIDDVKLEFYDISALSAHHSIIFQGD
jgi:hypothetical protein